MRDVPVWQLGFASDDENCQVRDRFSWVGYRCSVCGGSGDSGDAVLFDSGDRVCAGCRVGYLQDKSADYTEEYLADNQEDFLAYIEERLM